MDESAKNLLVLLAGTLLKDVITIIQNLAVKFTSQKQDSHTSSSLEVKLASSSVAQPNA